MKMLLIRSSEHKCRLKTSLNWHSGRNCRQPHKLQADVIIHPTVRSDLWCGWLLTYKVHVPERASRVSTPKEHRICKK